ncbi:hypothetical protein [Alteromonas sp. BMJM2]|uniref:hypothetical protein n=1 Tax=Alteromonas sp. BMJM2 TaxID=2954241 RepID=UPI0022B5DB33|nr:hypothetical protein [Alteromonas sp. BMJM2]
MKNNVMTLFASMTMLTTLVIRPAQATLIEDVGYGIDYQLGVHTNAIYDEELGGVTSVLRDEAIGDQTNIDRTAKIRGDLSTGSVGAKTTLIPSIPSSSLATNAVVTLIDTLTFDLSGQVAGSTVDLGIGIDWEGIFFPYLSSRPSRASLQFSLISDDDELSLATTVYPDNFVLSFLNPGFEAGDPLTFGDPGFQTPMASTFGDWTSLSDLGDTFNGLFSLETGKITVVDFRLSLNVSGNADFFNSAHLAFDSPISFTSASGVFMNATQVPPSSVSAPVTSWLLLSSLGAIALCRRTMALKR